MSTQLAVYDRNQFAITNADTSNDAVEALKENLGGDRLSEFDLDQVKVPSGGSTVWEVPGISGTEAAKEITGVIVHMGKRRAYWSNPDPSGESPDCSSKDGLTGRGDPGGSCETCPMNEWGSSTKEGSRGKACNERLMLFVVRKDDPLPLVISCPPSSLGALKKFRTRLRVPYWKAITSLTLVRKTNDGGQPYSEIVPALAGVLDDEAAAAVKKYADQMASVFSNAKVES
jgi:hypothetical protein